MAIFSAIAAVASWVSGWVFTTLAGAGMTFGTALALGKAAGYLVTAGIYMMASRALRPKINVQLSDIQAVIQQDDAPRRVYVGQALAGGIRAFFDTSGGSLYQLVVVQHGKVSGWQSFWVDGERVTIDGTGKVTSGPKSGHVSVYTRDGSADGGNYGELSGFASWPSDRKLTGQATFLVVSRAPSHNDFMKIFPKAHQTLFQWEIRGEAVYDPRSTSWGWSDNAALVVAHYLTHAGGYRLTSAEMDWPSVSALADWCAAPVEQAAGGTAPRMRLWGWWTFDEDPSQVLERMRISSGIRAYEMQNGKIGLIGGPFGTPACTLTASDIRQIETTDGTNEREGYNMLRVVYMSADHNYTVTEAEPWLDLDRLEIEGEIVEELGTEMSPNLSQSRRLAKQTMHDGNRPKVEIITNLVGLKARYPRFPGQRHTILLDYRPEDGSGRVIQGEYEVLDHEFDPIGLECRIELAKVDRGSMEWSVEEEGTQPLPLPGSSADGPPPISATLTPRLVQATSTSAIATLEIEAVAISGRSDLTIEAQYRKVGDTSWTPMSVQGLEAVSGAVEDGATYEARVRFRGTFAGVDEWEPLGPITVQVNSVPPPAPTELIASPGMGYVHLSWRNPIGEFSQLRIYRGVTSSLSAASLVATTGGAAGQISEAQDASVISATDYFYWVRAANVSGVEGPAAGPALISFEPET